MQKKKETRELYKQEKGKRKVKNSAGVSLTFPSSLLKLSTYQCSTVEAFLSLLLVLYAW